MDYQLTIPAIMRRAATMYATLAIVNCGPDGFAVPAIGALLHTLNLRLHANDLAYIIEHSGKVAPAPRLDPLS